MKLFFLFLSITSLCAAQSSETGKIVITIADSTTGQPTPARVRITKNGNVVKTLPQSAIAIMYGVWDHADGYGFQPDSSFYVDGSFEVDLPPGRYVIALTKGIEFIGRNHTIDINSNTIVRKTYQLQRWIDMPRRGWYSADDHIHVKRSPREDPLLMKWIQAEDVHVGVLLKMGDFWQTYYGQYAWGTSGAYNDGNYMLTSGQEDPRTPEIGHTIGIGASAAVRFRSEYYYFDKVFDQLHELGGITGYAHQAESFHGYRGLMLDGLRRKVDIMEILQFCVSEDPLLIRYYYHMLDLGYAITAVAGSDFPWCGNDHSIQRVERNAKIGNVRFYSYLDQSFSFDTWKKALKRGHTFVTSGPMLELLVNGKLPGDTLHVKKGESIIINAKALGDNVAVPLDKLEVVLHGEVVATQTSSHKGQSKNEIVIKLTQNATKGFWVAARAFGSHGQAAHTTPVYVSVDNSGFHNPTTLSKYLSLASDYLDELEKELQTVNSDPERQVWKYRDGLEKRIKATREIISDLKTLK